MLIKNKLSREAFYVFLQAEYPGKDQLLGAFLVLEQIKKETRNELTLCKKTMIDVVTRIKGISMTVPLDSGTIESQIFLVLQNLKDITSSDSETLRKKISQAQAEILLLMTPLYDFFLDSDSYKEFELINKEKERKNYFQSSPSESVRIIVGEGAGR